MSASRFAIALWAVAVLLLLTWATVNTLTAPDTYPFGDTATTSIYALRAAEGNLAVGSYSRFRWNHPGPLLYQVLAGPYQLSGRREIALKWTALIVNLTWLAAALAISGRRSPAFGVALAAALVPLLWREPRLLVATWNPFTPVLALLAGIVAAADVGARGWWSLPLLMVALSFAVQSHVALALVSLTLLLTIILNVTIGRYVGAPSHSSAWKPAGLMAVTVVMVLWAAPLAHELRRWPGNLSAIATFFSEPHPHPGWRRTGSVAAYELGGPATSTWHEVGGEVPRHVPLWIKRWAVCQPVLLLVCAWLAHRRGEHFGRSLALTSLGATLVVPLAVHGITGPVFEYLVLWAAVISCVNLGVMVATLLLLTRAPLDQVRHKALWLLIVIGFWAVIGGIALSGKHRDESSDTTIRALTLDLMNYCDRHQIRRPLLRFADDEWHAGVGIVLQFLKADREIAVADEVVFLVGEPFARSGREGGEFQIMLASDRISDDGQSSMEWVTTRGAYRIVRVIPLK